MLLSAPVTATLSLNTLPTTRLDWHRLENKPTNRTGDVTAGVASSAVAEVASSANIAEVVSSAVAEVASSADITEVASSAVLAEVAFC